MRLKVFGKVREIPDLAILAFIDVSVTLLLLVAVNTYYAGTPYYPVFIGLVVLVALGIPFLYFYREYLLVLERERYFPQFLRDIADVYRTGVSLVQAIYHASKQNYGALTPQVKKLAVRLSWGVPFEKAFELFAKETKSPTIQGASLIILEAFNSGGDVANILDTVAQDMRRIKDIKEERKSRFSTFVGTMYVVFLISVFLAHILLNVLLPEIPVLPSFNLSFNITGTTTTGGVTSIPLYEMKVLFLHLLLIQAVVSGLIAGIVGEGSWTAGLKHVLFMSFLTLVLFHLFILPTDPVDRLGRTIAKLPVTFSMTVDLGKIYVEKNITKEDVVAFMERYGAGFGLRSFPDFTFQQDIRCGQCGRDVFVHPDRVIIKRPLYLTFTVVSNGDGTVTVFVGDGMEAPT